VSQVPEDQRPASVPGIAVVTVTRGRPGLLARVSACVRAQSVTVPVEHLVIVDECPKTAAALGRGAVSGLTWMHARRTAGEHNGPGRIARLRNLSATMTGAAWLAFLDDDNLWREDHLASLLARAGETGCRAVHSHRELRRHDGQPYLAPHFPWAAGPGEAREKYERAVAAGVMRPGSAVIRSTTDPAVPGDLRFVDMGEWLIARSLLREVPLVEEFTIEQEKTIGEDDFWLADLLGRGEPIACTGQPTLRYFLGGRSTTETEDWPAS
jgi:hypothetical protein